MTMLTSAFTSKLWQMAAKAVSLHHDLQAHASIALSTVDFQPMVVLTLLVGMCHIAEVNAKGNAVIT
jgi:hypothetical protein